CGDPDARRARQRRTLPRHRRGDRLHDLLRERVKLRERDETVDDDDELVPAKPRNGIALSHRREQARGDRAQQMIARRMAVAVVDRLESVEIEIEKRELRTVA